MEKTRGYFTENENGYTIWIPSNYDNKEQQAKLESKNYNIIKGAGVTT